MAQAVQSKPWANRITGYADVPPDQLLASPNNFRRHPTTQQNALLGVVSEIGYLDPVLVQQSSGMVIDGHLRVELALRTGQPTIPVQYVDLTDDEANLALASFDPVSAMAFHDAEQLRALLDEVSTSDAAVMAMLSELAESAGVIPPDFDPNAEWGGMPDYSPESESIICKRVTMLFGTPEDVKQFGELIGEEIPTDTGLTSIWFPHRDIQKASMEFRDADES